MKRYILLIAFSFFIAGCSSYKMSFLNENYAPTHFRVPASFENLEVEDLRKDVTGRDVLIPSFCFTVQNDFIRPELTSYQRDLIMNEVTRYSDSSKPKFKAKVQLVEGSKQVRAALFSDQESVNVVIKIIVYDDVHTPYFISATGEASYDIKAFKASQQYSEQLYQKAIKTAVYKCMDSLNKSFIKSNTPSQDFTIPGTKE